MTEHTASTRHIIDLHITTPGDEGPSTHDLREAITEGLKRWGIEVLYLGASEDVGLGGEEAAVVLNDEETYTNLDGCSVRRLDYTTHEKGLDYSDELGPVLLEL